MQSLKLDRTIVRTLHLTSFIVAGLFFIFSVAGQEPGSVDSAFGLNATPDARIYALAQDGQKIFAGGDFTKLGESSRARIARLNADGSVDLSFNPGEGFNSTVFSLAVQGDGKLLAGGAFTAYNGNGAQYLARLDANGTLDTSFNIGTGPNSYIYSILPLPTGDTLLGGSFSAFNGSTARPYVLRLKSDGTVDITFNPADLNGQVLAISVQSDGKIVIGGDFTSVSGQPRNRIARLNANGSMDTSFDPGAGADASVRTVNVLADGAILLGGSFGTVNGAPIPYVARISANGLPDFSFQSTLNSSAHSAVVQPDGRIVIVGDFTGNATRLRINGSRDSSFTTGSGANSTISAVLLQANGDLVIGGAFTQFNGAERKYLARLKGSKLAAGGEFNFSSSTLVAGETQPSVSLEVRRTGNTGGIATIEVATSNGSATAADYVAKTETLNFASGETRRTFTVLVRQDTALEDDETFIVTLRNPTGGAEIGVEGVAQVTIVSDDNSMIVGSVDTVPGAGSIATSVNAIDINSEGKMLVGGDFRAINGQSRFNIARLDSTGALDPAFLPTAWADSTIYSIATHDDGKILIGGTFSIVNGQSRRYLARLNADGTFDRAFAPEGGPNSYIHAIVPLTFGDALIGGSFSAYNSGPAAYLAKIYGDGTVDTLFNPQVNGTVGAIVLQPDGKMLIGGEFTSVGGVQRNRIARLNSDGSLDRSFDPGAGPDSVVRTMALQPDGRILIGGSFGTVNGGTWRYAARLLASGLPDPAFLAEVPSTVFALERQPDGRIIVGGDFPGRLLRLAPDGSIDPSFQVGAGADGSVFAVALQSDGRIIAGGAFKRFNDRNRVGLVRLQGRSSASGGEFEFSAPSYTVSEAQPTLQIEVRRSANLSQSASVDYETVTATANAGDFVPISGKLNFAPHEERKSLTLTIRADTDVEDDETFLVSLLNPGPGAELGSVRSTLILIRNDDASLSVGSLDTAFAGTVRGTSANVVAFTEEGTILIGGDFRVINGKSRYNITRLLTDGQVDESFNPSAWLDGPVYVITPQQDGKIMVGGAFTTVIGTVRPYLARLNQDGTYDRTFNPVPGPNSHIHSITLLPEGDMLVGGTFNSFNGAAKTGLARLFSDGSLDESFEAQIAGNVFVVRLQSDRKIIIAGEFATVNGQNRTRVARLNSNGSLDLAFDPGAGPDSTVRDLVILPDNKVLIGGTFSTVNGFPHRFVSRLHPNGLPDVSFSPELSAAVHSLDLQLDGKIVVGGDFNGRLTRLKPNGALDPTFDVGTGANSTIYDVAVQPDGNILALGNFTEFDDLARPLLVRTLGLSSAPGGEVQFAAPVLSVLESQGTIVAEVRRTGSSEQAVSVDFNTITASATAGDYTPQNGTLILGIGETRKNITIAIRSDEDPEDNEAFAIVLSNPSEGLDLGSERRLEVRILNDDFFSVPGTPDLTHSVGTAVGTGAYAITPGRDNTILVGGDFRNIAGENRFNLARLRGDGTIDGSFNPALWLDGPVFAVAQQDDGKILVGGAFTRVSGQIRQYICRLNANGTVDAGFDPGTGPNSYIYSLLPLPGGECLAGGIFSSYKGENRAGLVKLFSDGTRDGTYSPQLNGAVRALAPLPDGRVLIGGDFTTVAGNPLNRIARLKANGTLDPTFDAGNGANSTVAAIAIQPDGRVVVGGAFGTLLGGDQRYLGRLMPNGGLDSAFTPAINGPIYALLADAAGNIHVGGSFSAINEAQLLNYAKLKSDGGLHPDSAAANPVNGAVHSLASDNRGRTLLAGTFTEVAGLGWPFIARLNSAADNTGVRLTRVVYAPNGIQIYATGGTGQAALESSTDLRIWSLVISGSLAGTESRFEDSNVGPRKFYRIRQP